MRRDVRAIGKVPMQLDALFRAEGARRERIHRAPSPRHTDSTAASATPTKNSTAARVMMTSIRFHMAAAPSE
jgi:hypothetical protein